MTCKYHLLSLFMFKLLKNSYYSNMFEQLTLNELANNLESTPTELEPTPTLKNWSSMIGMP